jgi:hypothetical protein
MSSSIIFESERSSRRLIKYITTDWNEVSVKMEDLIHTTFEKYLKNCKYHFRTRLQKEKELQKKFEIRNAYCIEEFEMNTLLD